MPEKVKEIQYILSQYKQEQLPPWDTVDENGKNPFVALSHAGRKQNWVLNGQYVLDFWEKPAAGAHPIERERTRTKRETKAPQSKL